MANSATQSCRSILGHEIVGRIEAFGDGVTDFAIGERVGVPWLGFTDGTCAYCRSGQENLCDRPLFTGYQIDGGYAEFAVADARYVFRLPDGLQRRGSGTPPLRRADRLPVVEDGRGRQAPRHLRLRRGGAYRGAGGAPSRARSLCLHAPGRHSRQDFARSLGAVWAGGSDQAPPQELDAAIIFAPVGALVPAALKAVRKGGIVVCGGIHMSDIPSFPYDILWGERVVRSVANLTREDARRVPGVGAEGAGENDGGGYPAGPRQRGACAAARRHADRRSRAHSLRRS